jgi:multiple antibiotic resistance protein
MLQEYLVAVSVAFAAMFPIINPVGHAPMFYAMTIDDTPGFRRRQALKTSLYVFLILFVSLVLGHNILRFFSITIDDLRIAGGLLVAHSAWNMLNNTSRVTPAEGDAAMDKDDISLTPMATPILAGPGAMSLAIGLLSYGRSWIQYGGYITGCFLIALLTLICLRYSDSLVKVISVNAMGSLNRILGFLILAIGVDLMVEGVKNSFFPGK